MNARRAERAPDDGESISSVTARILGLLAEERVLIDRLADCRVTARAGESWHHKESNLLMLEAGRS